MKIEIAITCMALSCMQIGTVCAGELETMLPGQAKAVQASELSDAAQAGIGVHLKRSARDGYFIIDGDENSARVLDQASELLIPPQMVSEHVVKKASALGTDLAGLTFIGYVREGPYMDATGNRITRLFEDHRHARVMLTVWDYRATGGSVVSITDFQNQFVDGTPATMALVRSPSGAALWKLTWTTLDLHYELYVEEPSLSESDENARKLVVLGYAKAAPKQAPGQR